MLSLFQQAAKLNNMGVNLLLEGNRRDAIRTLGNSIKLMKRALAEPDAIAADATSKQPALRMDITTTQTVPIPTMEASDTIIFSQAIRIPEDQIPNKELELNVYTSAAIFNVALTHHFKGDAESLTKAEMLYTMVINLLKGNTLNVHTAMVVKLACINNLSQIRYSKGDYKSARKGLSQVNCFLRESSNQAILERPDIQLLLMSVLLLKAPTVASAA